MSVSMINFSTSLRKNPLPGMTKFCATLILLVLIQLHHCLHHEKITPEETSFPEGKVAQPLKRSDELPLIRFLNSSQMEQPVIYHISNLICLLTKKNRSSRGLEIPLSSTCPLTSACPPCPRNPQGRAFQYVLEVVAIKPYNFMLLCHYNFSFRRGEQVGL